MNIKLIGMFNRALVGNEVSYDKIAEAALKAGYAVDPACATEDVLEFLREMKMNPNSTFYKTWEDITSKSRFELYLDQIRHYASTYGTVDNATLLQEMTNETVQIEYNVKGNGYVPNEEPIVIPYEKFKVIKAATAEEIRDLILKMFASGAAMSSDTINVCIEFLKEYNFLASVDTDLIKNKEAQAVIASMLKKYPKDEFGLLRCIMYRYTGKTALIKDRSSIYSIQHKNGFGTGKDFDLAILSVVQLKALSRIFLRYKPLFLAMKGYGDNAKYVNKIRRLAVKNHTPLKIGFWESCMNDNGKDFVQLINTAKANVDSLNNFKKVQLMQSIMERLVGKNIDGKMYVIRNGKMYIREGYKPRVNTTYLMQLYEVLKNSLVEALKAKAGFYYIPNALHIACPTSEKNFIGNYPMGTSVDFGDKDNVIGVYWRNEWGTRDFDLHYCDVNGRSFGWCYSYGGDSDEPIYSGDMTNADPEAAELFYMRKTVKDGLLTLNQFNGDPGSKFRLFVAHENMEKKVTEYGKLERRQEQACMCDPNNIIFDAMMDFEEQGQKNIGYIHNNKLYFTVLQSGNNRVSGKASEIVQKANQVKMDSFTDLETLLKEAGWKALDPKMLKEPVKQYSINIDGISEAEAKAKIDAIQDMLKVNPNAELPDYVDVKVVLPEEVENTSKADILDFTNPTKEMILDLFA